MTGVLGKFHNYEFSNYYFSLAFTFIIAMKSSNMKGASYLMCMKEMRMAVKTLLEDPEGEGTFRRPSHRNRVILKYTLTKESAVGEVAVFVAFRT